MPALVDTSIRLLSQEPLAQRMQSSRVLELAEILDGAGFAYLEVSGGGCFDSAVRRGVESPWERIRAIKGRVSTPLGIALRGRFLVGSRPVSGDIVGRFVSCAAENGIDVFRLHDPLNDVSNLREAGAAITSAGGAFHAGLVYSPGRTGETETDANGISQVSWILGPVVGPQTVQAVATLSGSPVSFNATARSGDGGGGGGGGEESVSAVRVIR